MSVMPACRNDRPINALCLALAAAIFAALAAFSAWLWQAGRAPLLLAPALGGLHNCLALGPRGAPADAACKKSKMPMPAPSLTEPLFSFELLRVAEVVVDSLMTMVTISPMPVAR